MDTTTVVDLGQQALWMTVLISAPLLAVALFVGLFIGVLQAATSINEATLSFIPKLAALALTLAVVGGLVVLSLLVAFVPDLSTKFSSSPIEQQTLFQFEQEQREGKGTEDYLSLTDEVLERLGLTNRAEVVNG